MLTKDQSAAFEAAGVVKVKSLLPEQTISVARRSIISQFEPLGLAKIGEWRLEDRPKENWPYKGYSAKKISNKLPEVERLIKEPAIMLIVTQLLGYADLDNEFFKRPQILVTLPNEGTWFMPNDGWHVDIARLKSGLRPGVQVFILLSEIKPKGGGTLVMAGSHRLLNNSAFIRPRDVTKRMRQEPNFKALEIVELTGEPGDVYFMDMRALHSGAPNMGDQPRIMAAHRFLRADGVPELKNGA